MLRPSGLRLRPIAGEGERAMKRQLALSTVALLLPVAAGGSHCPERPEQRRLPPDQAPLTAAQAQALSTNVTDKVIVVFKNQLPATPDSPGNAADRAAAVDQVQAGVVHELAQTGARQVKRFQIINAAVGDRLAGRGDPPRGQSGRAGGGPRRARFP